jgi:hypothetical protein
MVLSPTPVLGYSEGPDRTSRKSCLGKYLRTGVKFSRFLADFSTNSAYNPPVATFVAIGAGIHINRLEIKSTQMNADKHG